jgi:DNA-binding NarL/FixJ family response regulator
LRSRFASAPLLVFAERLPSSEASIAQSLGATVCADKAATVEQITVLLAALLRGNVAKNIVLQPQHEAVHPALIRLTGREREVLAVLADGCTNRDIGRRLNMQEATAKAHMRQIFKKLGVSNRTQAAALALRLRDYH